LCNKLLILQSNSQPKPYSDMEYIYIALIIAFFGFLASTPIMLLMFFTNKSQRKYFKLLAEKYRLSQELGTKIIMRDFPLVKGYINKRWFSMSATTVNRIDRSFYKYPVQNLKQPMIKLSLAVPSSNYSSFSLNSIKSISKKERVSMVDFYEYFDVNTEPQHEERRFLSSKIRKKCIEYCEDYRDLHCSISKNELIAFLPKELTKEKRYKEILLLIEILDLIAEEVSE